MKQTAIIRALNVICICLFVCTACNNKTEVTKYYYCAYQPISVTWQYDSTHVYRFGNDYVELRVNEPSVPQGMGYEQLLRLSFERPWRDKVIELTFEDGKVVAGNAWVTTDEFDYGRETAYLPGECVVPLSDIRYSADTLYFSLDFRNVTYFSDAVDISIHSDREAWDSGYHEWVNNKPIHKYYEQGEDSVAYKACIYEDSIVVLTQVRLGPTEKSACEWTREAETFVGMSRNEVIKRDRHYPKEMEEKNRLDCWNK